MRRRLAIAGALWAVTLHGPAKAQQTAAATASVPRQTERNRRARVEFSVWGRLPERDGSTLFSLLEQELSSSRLVLLPTETEPSSEDDFLARGSVPLTLMRAALDVRSASDWRILIVDVERGRVISRLQRGPDRNAAALEGSVSILAAAAVALHEGFEITSTLMSPAISAPIPTPTVKARPPTPLQMFGTLGVSLATFERHVPWQLGPAAAIGLRFHQQVALRLSASHFFAQRFESSFGRFDLDRTRLALGGGPIWIRNGFEGEVSLGLSAEVLRRRNAAPAAGVKALPSSAVFRAGAEGEVRVRYRLTHSLSLELTAGGAYFPRAVRFSAASGADSVLATPFKLVALGGASVELCAP